MVEINTEFRKLHSAAPRRGFIEAVSVCFNNYITFSGRASRSEFWYFFLFRILALSTAMIVDMALFSVDMDMMENFSGPFSSATSLILWLPYIAVGFRRMHDIGRTGWWITGNLLLSWMVLPLLVIFTLMALESGQADKMLWLIITCCVILAGIVFYMLTILVFLCQKGRPWKNRFG